MNKLFVVFLAICLVSVHAFVRRDAPQAGNDQAVNIEQITKQAQEFFDSVGKKFTETVNPDEIKKNFNNVLEEVQKALNQLKANTDAPKN